MPKQHRWIVSQLADGFIHLAYTGSGVSFEAPDPKRASVEQIEDFFSEQEIDRDELIRFGLLYWIENRKRVLASGGEHAVEARKLRDLAKALRRGEIPPSELSWLLDALK